MFSTLTRFIEDCPYVHLITNKCIILTEDQTHSYSYRTRGTRLHPTYNPLRYLEDLAALKGAQVIQRETSLYSSTLSSKLHNRMPIIINSPYEWSDEDDEQDEAEDTNSNRTYSENSKIRGQIQGAHPHEEARKLYICNFQTEIRYGRDRFGKVRWRHPYAVEQQEIRVLMNRNCNPTRARNQCVERFIELSDKTGLDNLHIEFLSPKMPLIVDNSREMVRDDWCTSRNFVVDNFNWSYENPYGKVCEAHAGNVGLDQYSWSVNQRNPGDRRFKIRCHVMVLIGITDRYLEYSRWRLLKVLYWKRLEPSGKIKDYHEKSPVVIHCPSLTSMKIFSIVRKKENERAHLPQFSAPLLGQLVLVSLKDSEECWDVKRLLNNQWPETLKRLTLSAHHMSEGPVLNVPLESLPPGYVDLSHLIIQRMIPNLNGPMRFTELRYLEIDVTVIPAPTVVATKNYELGINILIEEHKFPAIKTLILSVPHKANATHNFAIPVTVNIPKSCETVGVASMLSHSTVRINGTPVTFSKGFTAWSRREVFVAFVRDVKDRFVLGVKLMAEMGRSLDTCLDIQWDEFDLERKAIAPDQ